MKKLVIEPSFILRCYKITEKYEKLWGRWLDDLQLFHIIKEVCELSNVLRNKNNKFGQRDSEEYKREKLDELADVFLTTFATAGKLEITPEELNNAIQKKLDTVGERVEKLEKEAELNANTDEES